MVEAFLKSIGVGDDVLEHLDKAELAFQRPVLLWVGLLLLIPIGWFIFRRQRDNLGTLPQKFRITLTVTRIVVLFVLVCMLAGPYLKIDHQITKRPIVAVLLDHSQSMQLPAGPFASDEELFEMAAVAGHELKDKQIPAEVRTELNQISRADLADAAIRHSVDTFLKPLSKDYDVRFYSFSRDANPIAYDENTGTPLGEQTTEPGNGSHLGDALSHVLAEAAGQQVAGMLLLSDGENTGGESPVQATRAAADVRTAIYVAPIGPLTRIADVSIVDVYTSGLVTVGDTVSVNVSLESQGFDGKPVKVELRDGDVLLDTEEIVVRDAEHQHVELTFKAEKAGARYLTINVPPLDAEVEQLRANNADTALVRVSEDRIRVLFIDGSARWDFRFVKNAIRRDNGLAGRTAEMPDVVLESEWRRLPDDQKAASLPQTLDEIAEYHSIILGDVSPELLTPAFQDLLIRAVREKGVGLMVEAGPQSMPHRFDASFLELLPVRLKQGVAGVEAPVYEPYEILVSADGLVHETMRLYDDPGHNHRVWSHMPAYYWCAAAEQPAPAATVLAWNPKLEGRFGKTPLIAYHYAGDGKVMFVGTDSTWAWRQNVGDRYFYKFWGQAIRFVARREADKNKSSLEVRPFRAQPGEEAQIELMAFSPSGTPVKMPSREVTLLGPGERQTIELTEDKAREGRYVGTFTPDTPGIHRLVYEATGAEPVEATLQVLMSPEEFRHPNVNRPALELIARSTGGEVVKLSELGSIPEKLKGETELQSLHREATIWDNWLTLSLLIVVYSVDVGIRRLMGLV